MAHTQITYDGPPRRRSLPRFSEKPRRRLTHMFFCRVLLLSGDGVFMEIAIPYQT
ncbi:MAG: hypothetical protein IKQ80_06050 [Clostridia bacterium]|nr:hypothetical protein [Clostridia bacterium]